MKKNNRILVIAHAPLASALRMCALHVFPDCGQYMGAMDVQADAHPGASLGMARIALMQLRGEETLLLTDIVGATPCNVAQLLAHGGNARLLAGVNLPMLLRSITYIDESLDELTKRALSGGQQGVMMVDRSLGD